MQLGRKEHKKSKGKIIIAKGRNSQMDILKKTIESIEQFSF